MLNLQVHKHDISSAPTNITKGNDVYTNIISETLNELLRAYPPVSLNSATSIMAAWMGASTNSGNS
jgi:hypothetical protein